MNIALLLLFAICATILSTWLFIKFFQDKTNLINKKMFKIVGSSGFAETEISESFGIVSFKSDFDVEKNVVCYSYRERINRGTRVLITDYDLNKEMYVVDEYPR